MKKGIIFLMAFLLSCAVAFAKTTRTQDTLHTTKSWQKKTESAQKQNVKIKNALKGEDSPKENVQVNNVSIETKVQPTETKNGDTLSTYVSALASKLDKQQDDIQQIKKQKEDIQITWDKILLLLLTLQVLGILIFLFADKEKRRDEILYTITGRKSDKETPRLLEWKNDIIEKAVEKAKQIQPASPSPKSNNSELELIIRDLQKRIAVLEDASKKKAVEQDRKDEEPSKPNITVPSSRTLYADAIINGELNKVTEQPNDDTVYELFLKDQANKTAEVTIYSYAYRRVLETPDFIEGCEKQRINNPPNNLQVEKGDAQLQDNGKWQIIKKVSVKFIS